MMDLSQCAQHLTQISFLSFSSITYMFTDRVQSSLLIVDFADARPAIGFA